MIPLFARYPLLKEKIPYTSFGEFPTPVIHLSKLGRVIGAQNLFLKHDGLSGPVYGGNKIRKLEFILADALHRGAGEVLTFGFAGSNHALATAVYAKKLGLGCMLVLLAQPNAGYVRHNLLMSHVCGAEIHHYNREIDACLPTSARLIVRVLKHGKAPYIISPGGSSPIGVIGYVNAGFELKEQIDRGMLPEPDHIFVPLGTMGTAVGLVIGLKAAGLKTRVVSVRVVNEKYGNADKFAGLFMKTLKLIRSIAPSFPQIELTDDEIDIRQDYFGEQYARFTEKGMTAIDLVAESEGIVLDGTYTGKTMAALIDRFRNPELREEVVLFWNTCNARDFSGLIEGIDYQQMPRGVHRYFEEDIQPLDKRHSRNGRVTGSHH